LLSDWGLFFGLFLRRPVDIAAAFPSGRHVADAMARQLNGTGSGHVLELGAGTGSITAGLLRGGCRADRLVVLEREPALAEVLRRRFPGVTVVEGDATTFGPLLAERGIGRLAQIVSSLPIKWFPFAAQRAVVEQSFAALGPAGSLVQLTNAMESPLPSRRLGLEARQVERIWLNFLPVQIWSYRRVAATGEIDSSPGETGRCDTAGLTEEVKRPK
jgi:phosphatidylethanolamine/phosphatidyl-N-methylethanolamine N-methyltransferase